MATTVPRTMNDDESWLSGLPSNPNNQVGFVIFRNPTCQQLHLYLQSELATNIGICNPDKTPVHNGRFALIVMCLLLNETAYRNVDYDSMAFKVINRVWHDVKQEFNRKHWNWEREKWIEEKGKFNRLFMGARCENYITNGKLCGTYVPVFHPEHYLAADFSRPYPPAYNASIFTLCTCIRLCWRQEQPPDFTGALVSGYSRFLHVINASTNTRHHRFMTFQDHRAYSAILAHFFNGYHLYVHPLSPGLRYPEAPAGFQPPVVGPP